MSDSTQRRGTDYDTLRGMGAGAGSRVPRTADDPLEELARLVSQNEPVRPSPQAAAGEPRSTYTAAPRAPQATERFDAPSYNTARPAAPPAFEARDQQRAYGSSAQQGYGPSDDFFADLEPVAPRVQNDRVHNDRGQSDYDYPSHTDDFDAGYDPSFQSRSPFQDDFDDLSHQPYADDGDMHDEVPARRRGGLLVKLGGIAAALALVLGGGVWAFGALTGGSSGGTPPVIKAESTTPVKVVPEAKPVARAKESYDRVDPNANANVVASAEEPGEKPTAPRVILPGAPAPGTQERVTETASASLAPQPPAASEPEANGNSRRVRTMVIRPDSPMGSAPPEQPSSVQALAAPEAPPQTPIQGAGEAAGMSMERPNDFGIMATESAPAPHQQTAAVSDEVPMPMPRPLTAEAPPAAAPTAQNDPFARQDAAPQTRAATQAPAPAASTGGPPSSPQPQVQVTNKRPLKPANVPGRQSAIPSSSPVAAASPAAQPRSIAPQQPAPRQVATTPVTTQSTRPTQVAMASPVPVAVSAAPQIATVAGSSGGAFGVQLTAQRTEQEAIAAFNAIKQRNPAVLGNYNPAIARADLGPDRGIFYRAMVPASSQSEASNLCIQFKAAGVDCIVQRR